MSQETNGESPSTRCDSTSIILESISDGVFTVDSDWKITSFNRAAEEITGVPRDEAVGRPCSEVFRASMCESDCALRRTLDTGDPIINRAAYMVNASGIKVPISVSTAILKDESGVVIGGAETFRDLTLVEELRRELEGRYHVGDFISRSRAMRRIFEVMPQVAASDSSVLIQGETGTGKELLARAIHTMSPRKNGPFIAVNCSAIPDTLLESELFGFVKGAFTGADRDKPGRFSLADGGSLFLDEIGDITPALQVRLLRVLQEKHFEPLGSIQTVSSNVRIITATNRDLEADLMSGSFRQDLYYRINVIKLVVPPLRSRREDIPLLIDHFIGHFNHSQGKTVGGVTPEVMAVLLSSDYPGNVRELENIIEHAFVLCSEGEIELSHLPEGLIGHVVSSAKGTGLQATTRAIEAQTILEALQRHGYNRLETARSLGMHKSTLFRKIRALDLILPKQDGRSKS